MFKILIAFTLGYLCGWFITLVHQAYLKAKMKSSTAQLAFDLISKEEGKYLFISLEDGEWRKDVYNFYHRHAYNLDLLDVECIHEIILDHILPAIDGNQDSEDFLIQAKGLIK